MERKGGENYEEGVGEEGENDLGLESHFLLFLFWGRGDHY